MNLADLFISPKDPATGGFYAPLVLHLAVSPGHSCQALDSGPSSRLTRLAAWSVQPRVGHPTLSLRCRQVKRPFEGPLRILAWLRWMYRERLTRLCGVFSGVGRVVVVNGHGEVALVGGGLRGKRDVFDDHIA
jgi:hypothetical protein